MSSAARKLFPPKPKKAPDDLGEKPERELPDYRNPDTYQGESKEVKEKQEATRRAAVGILGAAFGGRVEEPADFAAALVKRSRKARG